MYTYIYMYTYPEDVLCSVEKRGAPIVSSSSDPIKHGDKNLSAAKI